MRVLQVLPGLSSWFGGPSVALPDLARALSRRGVETCLFTTNADPGGRLDVPLGRPIDQAGATVVYFNVWPLGRYLFSMPLARALHRCLPQYDVAHIHWLYPFSSLATAVLAHQSGVPYVLQFNGSLDPHLMRKNTAVKKTYMALAGQYIVDHASALIFTSEAERRHAVLDGVTIPSFVVPIGLHWADYATLPARGRFRKTIPEIRDRRIILFLGRISRQKGLDLLVTAFGTILTKHPDAHLVIAGPDGEDYGPQVRRWVADAGLQRHVTFAGRVPDELKQAAYVDSDVFVLPSYAENFGATVTEALACRRPVVISNRVNICDEMAQAEAGLVVACSPDAVADGVCRVLDDPALAERLSGNGYDLVQRMFTWDAALDVLLPLYETVAGLPTDRRDGRRPS